MSDVCVLLCGGLNGMTARMSQTLLPHSFFKIRNNIKKKTWFMPKKDFFLKENRVKQYFFFSILSKKVFSLKILIVSI